MKNNKFRKYLLMLIVLVISSCSNQKSSEGGHPAADGLVFDYYKDFELEGTNYQISLPSNIENAIFYIYQETEYKTTASSWIINYYYESEYLTSSNFNENDQVIKGLYEKMMLEKEEISNLLEIDFNPSNPYEVIEMEVKLENIFDKEIGCVFFDKYIPIRIKNNSTYVTSTISIPLERKHLIKCEEMIESPLSDEIIQWEEFLAIKNLSKLNS